MLLLRNHGPVTIGATVAQALVLMWTVTRACEVQLATQSMGEAIPIPPAVLEKCVADSFQFNAKYSAGEDAFAALPSAGRSQGPELPHVARRRAAGPPGSSPRGRDELLFDLLGVHRAGLVRPSSNTSPGVPRMRCFWPNA